MPSPPLVIATIGPGAVEDQRRLKALLEGAPDMVRVNCSHTDPEDAEALVGWIRRKYPGVKVLFDLQGAKVRVGRMRGEVRVSPGDEVVFMPQAAFDQVAGRGGRAQGIVVPVQCPFAFGRMRRVSEIRMKDGTMSFRVTGSRQQGEVEAIWTETLEGGVIRAEKGMNAPGVDRSGVGLTPKDVRDLEQAAEIRPDGVCVSFVTGALEMDQAREVLARLAPGFAPAMWAKVECLEGIAALDEIVRASDAVLIGQGDLAGELGPVNMRPAAEGIARRVVAAGLPCAVGTGLLDSMRSRPEPTLTDVGNVTAFLGLGVSGFLLTAETTLGQHPAAAIAAVRKIAADWGAGQS